MTQSIRRVLVTGACGQIGSELTLALRARYGVDHVVASDIRSPQLSCRGDEGPFFSLDVCDRVALQSLVDTHNIDTIYHMAAILSATGEERPQAAWTVNTCGLLNVLETAAARRSLRIFCPSSIAVFGPTAPKQNTPQATVLQPTTMYGITKVTGELLGDYFAHRYGIDVRGVRYPGIISSETPPGGGTTDYAVEVFYHALRDRRYTFFVRPDTVLPMMYMPDCIKATLDLMDADVSSLQDRCSFNIASMSFSAAELAEEIRRHIPGFVCTYNPDRRQDIADSWPQSVDDTPARSQWGWSPTYDLRSMVKDMLTKLSARLA